MGGQTSSENVLKARIQGFEMEVGYDAPLVFGSIGYSHLRGDDEVADEPLANIAADKVAVTLGGRITPLDLEDGWRMLAAAEQDRVPHGVDHTTVPPVNDLFVTLRPPDHRCPRARRSFGVAPHL